VPIKKKIINNIKVLVVAESYGLLKKTSENDTSFCWGINKNNF